MPKLRNGNKGDSNPRSLDCESGILPLSYSAVVRSSKSFPITWLEYTQHEHLVTIITALLKVQPINRCLVRDWLDFFGNTKYYRKKLYSGHVLMDTGAWWSSGLERWPGDWVVLGSNPAAATSLRNFGNSVDPTLPMSFGGDT